MVRNRGRFLEDVFFATGNGTVPPIVGTPVAPATPTPTINPTEPVDDSNPVLPLTPEVSPLSPEIGTQADEDIVASLNDIKDVLEDQYPKPYFPYFNYPLGIPKPYVVLDDMGTPVTPVYTGGGGGGGSMPMEEEVLEEEKIMTPPADNKKKILLLIVLAVGVYLAYRYWKKK